MQPSQFFAQRVTNFLMHALKEVLKLSQQKMSAGTV